MTPDPLTFILDNVFLIAVAFVSGAMLIWPAVRRGAGGASVSTLEATQLINRQNALVLDVRGAEEFGAGHILSARNIPLAQLESRLSDLGKHKDKPIIVVCQTGSRSGAAASALRKGGFAQVFNLSGGVAAWQQAGLPLEK